MQLSVQGRPLRDAVLATVVYADLFNFPLARAEVHRDLIGVATTPAETERAIAGLVEEGALVLADGAVILPGRAELAAQRRERRAHAAHLWPRARRFGQLIARYPFVRMVAVSGSLAADNPDPRADIDYLIVTAPGRLWLVRGLAVLLVRAARLAGAQLCPNYLLTTRALTLQERDLYTAHELLQAVPLTGTPIYQQFLADNCWAATWLPNRFQGASSAPALPNQAGLLGRVGEATLGGRVGDRIEGWEAARKRRRLGAGGQAMHFTDDVCAGHYGLHRRRVLREFQARCLRAGVSPAFVALPWSALSDPLPASTGAVEVPRQAAGTAEPQLISVALAPE
jgi:hypothetical protein